MTNIQDLHNKVINDNLNARCGYKRFGIMPSRITDLPDGMSQPITLSDEEIKDMMTSEYLVDTTNSGPQGYMVYRVDIHEMDPQDMYRFAIKIYQIDFSNAELPEYGDGYVLVSGITEIYSIVAQGKDDITVSVYSY